MAVSRASGHAVVEHEAAAPTHSLAAPSCAVVCYDYAMKDSFLRGWQVDRKRHGAFPVQKETIRELPNPPFRSEYLFCGLEDRLLVPTPPLQQQIATLPKFAVLVTKATAESTRSSYLLPTRKPPLLQCWR